MIDLDHVPKTEHLPLEVERLRNQLNRLERAHAKLRRDFGTPPKASRRWFREQLQAEKRRSWALASDLQRLRELCQSNGIDPRWHGPTSGWANQGGESA